MIERQEIEETDYDREKTLAIVTGIVCALIFLCGTALGAYHSVKAIGFIGVLSVACYLIADAAVIWSAYIDYKESGTPMEWAAWGVKYGLSLYLLVSGGCIVYVLIGNTEAETGTKARSGLYQKTYDDCMAKPKAKAADCRRLASEFNNGETKLAAEDRNAKREENSMVEWYVNLPLFKYIPGILGLAGLFVLTLVSKLQRPRKRRFRETSADDSRETPKDSRETPQTHRSANLRQSSARGNFTVGSLPDTLPALSPVNNGNGFSFSFKPSGKGYQLHFRERGDSGSKYVCNLAAGEARTLSGLSYEKIAIKAMERRRNKHGDDALVLRIASSLRV